MTAYAPHRLYHGIDARAVTENLGSVVLRCERWWIKSGVASRPEIGSAGRAGSRAATRAVALAASHSRSPPPRHSHVHGVPGAPRLVDLGAHKLAAMVALVEGDGDEAPRVSASQPQQSEAQSCDESSEADVR